MSSYKYLLLAGMLLSCVGYIHIYSNPFVSVTRSVSRAVQPDPENHPPIVRIITPVSAGRFDWHSHIEYAITVSDVEDGESDDLAIASNEVFLEVLYVPDTSGMKAYSGKLIPDTFESPGLQLFMKTDCLNCHAIKTSVQGPSFQDVARKYPSTPAVVKMLAERVIEGSSGVWGISAMASHPDLTQAQAEQIIQWILENALDPNRNYYSGTRGSFLTKARPENGKEGLYVLTATYIDQGLKGVPHSSKKGSHTIILRSK